MLLDLALHYAVGERVRRLWGWDEAVTIPKAELPPLQGLRLHDDKQSHVITPRLSHVTF